MESGSCDLLDELWNDLCSMEIWNDLSIMELVTGFVTMGYIRWAVEGLFCRMHNHMRTRVAVVKTGDERVRVVEGWTLDRSCTNQDVLYRDSRTHIT